MILALDPLVGQAFLAILLAIGALATQYNARRARGERLANRDEAQAAVADAKAAVAEVHILVNSQTEDLKARVAALEAALGLEHDEQIPTDAPAA